MNMEIGLLIIALFIFLYEFRNRIRYHFSNPWRGRSEYKIIYQGNTALIYRNREFTPEELFSGYHIYFKVGWESIPGVLLESSPDKIYWRIHVGATIYDRVSYTRIGGILEYHEEIPS